MSTTVDKSGERVQEMFAQIAPRYDLMNHLLSANVDRWWRRVTVRKVSPEGDAPILDVCTGTGDLAIAYHRATKGQVPIFAADFCREMLDIGRQKAARLKSGEAITFLEADTQNLPFESNKFQIVCVAFGLRNVQDTDAGLAEMNRVCQEGGRVAVLEFSKPRWQPMKGFYGFYFRHILPRVGQLLAKNQQDAYNYLPQSVSQFPDGPELCRRMEAVGMEDVKYYPLTFGIATLYVGRKRK